MLVLITRDLVGGWGTIRVAVILSVVSILETRRVGDRTVYGCGRSAQRVCLAIWLTLVVIGAVENTAWQWAMTSPSKLQQCSTDACELGWGVSVCIQSFQ